MVEKGRVGGVDAALVEKTQAPAALPGTGDLFPVRTAQIPADRSRETGRRCSGTALRRKIHRHPTSPQGLRHRLMNHPVAAIAAEVRHRMSARDGKGVSPVRAVIDRSPPVQRRTQFSTSGKASRASFSVWKYPWLPQFSAQRYIRKIGPSPARASNS